MLVLPDGSMKGWEREGLCFDRPPKAEVSWVRLGRTREAAILNKKRKVRGELWFLGPPRAWAQMDHFSFKVLIRNGGFQSLGPDGAFSVTSLIWQY